MWLYKLIELFVVEDYMKVKSRVIFRHILLLAICFAMGMMKSSMVHASDLTPVTEVDILDVSDDGNNVIVAGDTDICLAAGAFDKALYTGKHLLPLSA